MRSLAIIFLCIFIFSCGIKRNELPEFYQQVDQVIWVVEDLENVMDHWKILGFNQVLMLDTVKMSLLKSGSNNEVRIAMANLGGASITWIQPLEGESVFSQFHDSYGEGAMALIHRIESRKTLTNELSRLNRTGMQPLEEIKIITDRGNIHYLIMDSRENGKYFLGFVIGTEDMKIAQDLSRSNLHNMQINQYAFAITDPEPVSGYWSRIGLPEFQISHPDLGNKHYYGNPVDHDLIQGWQRHGSVAYEWCIPVSTPIVYDDHIKIHGEGIHHLAFSVHDMDEVLEDFTSKGYVISMGGTWGEEGKPGSGRYEYIDLDHAGGLTMELLWNFRE